jgi:hypothetical protein
VGLAPIAGGTGAAVMVKVTGTEILVAPVALIVMAPVYVPVAREPVAAVRVTEPLPVPEARLSANHAALSLAVQVRVPPPVLLIVRAWVAGLLPPCWAVNEKLPGLAPMAGAAVMVKVTGIETLVAPVALIVMAAV